MSKSDSGTGALAIGKSCSEGADDLRCYALFIRRRGGQSPPYAERDGQMISSLNRDVHLWIAVAAYGALAGGQVSAADSFSVAIRVNAAKPRGPLVPIWRFFGADEPNYAYMRDGKKLIEELGELAPKRVYFRAHNLLTSGDGTPALKW